MKRLSAGSEVDSWCTKCRLELGHRIVAMVGAAPKRVVCLTCGSEHNYRPAGAGQGERKPSAARDSSPARARTVAARSAARRSPARAERERQEVWANQVQGRERQAFVRYGTGATFVSGQLIEHPRFGQGFVERVLEDGKVSVVFRDATRTLVHGSG